VGENYLTQPCHPELAKGLAHNSEILGLIITIVVNLYMLAKAKKILRKLRMTKARYVTITLADSML